MFGQRRGGKRFTLLLLEEGEDYVQDWVGTCVWPSAVSGNWQGLPQLPGRIRLCTRSVFFEPDDVRVPIVRLPFASVKALEPPAPSSGDGGSSSGSSGPRVMRLTSTSCTKMKANMAEAPYVHEHSPAPGAMWQLSPSYSPLAPLLSASWELLRIARTPSKPERTAALEALVRKREDAAAFDSSRLVDFSERLVWCGAATQLTPLVRERGLLVVSDQRVYFQPLHNVSGGAPVRSHPLAGIAAVARRRSSLRQIGLELFFVDAAAAHAAAAASAASLSVGPAWQAQPGLNQILDQRRQRAADELGTGPWWDAPSAFFALRSEQDREAVLAALTGQPAFGRATASPALPPAPSDRVTPEPLLQARGLLLEAEGAWLQRVAAAWQHGRVSNFDYLLYLNLAAGRSFNDLAQWPVFPWVLSNYVTQSLDLDDASNFRDLSKPVGALNPTRLNDFKRRYREMQTDAGFEGSVPPFLYGTHYSTPGYVMFWLVRAAPAHMLRLQNGHFDAPDRLFGSIQESWQLVNSSSTDVKELIPEFYLPQADFLQNLQALPLGIRQNGQPVGDVVLPPWAHGSPARFLAMHRAALEAPAVSASLHHWIDLIFGYKQRGPAAEAADNVFYYLTYEGAVDLASGDRDATELKALETQINEFGQVPTQLFSNPHPARLVTPPAPDPGTVFGPGWQQAQQTHAAPYQQAAMAGSGADAESGSRALALALLTTVIAAAAPEFAAAQASPSASAQGASPAATAPAALPSSTGTGAAAATAAAAAPAAAPAGAAAHRLSLLGVLSPTQAPSPPAASGAASIVSRGSSLISSFLKLGRYAPAQEGASSSSTASASTDVHGAVAGTGAAGGPEAATDRLSEAPGGSVGSGQAVGRRDPAGEEEEEGGGVLVGGRALQGESSAACSGTSGAGQASTSASSLPARGEAARVTHESTLREVASPLQFQTRAEGQPVYCLSSDAGGTAGSWGAGLPGRLHDAGPQAVRRVRAGGVNQAITAVVLGAWDGRSAAAAHGEVGADAAGTCAQVTSNVSGEAGGDGRADAAGTSRRDSGVEGRSSGAAQTYVYCVGHAGHLQVLPFHDPGRPLRSAVLEGDLLCLAALSPCAASSGSEGRLPHPTLLAGSHTCKVHAYSVEQGRLLGSWEAHDDAVCCALLVPAGGGASAPTCQRLITSSWDCTVKVWSLAEGRCPWSGTLQLPEVQLQEFDSGVWALTAMAGSSSGGVAGPCTVVTGTEEGMLQAWDLRARGGGGGSFGTAAWQVKVADDYVGGVQLDPVSGHFVVAATADGALSLLDVRMSGARLAKVVTGASPLRCCITDGRLCVAGSEAGSLHLWDVELMSASGPGVGGALSQPALDGQYPAWQQAGLVSKPINSIAMLLLPDVAPGASLQAALALEDGHIAFIEA